MFTFVLIFATSVRGSLSILGHSLLNSTFDQTEKDKKDSNKKQKKRQQDSNSKRSQREFDIVMSGQFLAMFSVLAVKLKGRLAVQVVQEEAKGSRACGKVCRGLGPTETRLQVDSSEKVWHHKVVTQTSQ